VISGFEWFLLIVASAAVMSAMLLVAFWLESQRLNDVRSLSMLGESLGMRYRVLGRDHLFRPEPFVLHERPGSAAENSVIERSLVSIQTQGLPAVFEYVSYRDRMGVRRFGSPFLVLAARVPAGTPDLMLRPRGFPEKLAGFRQGVGGWNHHRVSSGRALPMDEPENNGLNRLVSALERPTASRLWIQVSGRVVYVAQPFRPWPGCGFTPSGVARLIRLALPVLKALDSPDASRLEMLMFPRAARTRTAAGPYSAEVE
jgi:hypothetical protein